MTCYLYWHSNYVLICNEISIQIMKPIKVYKWCAMHILGQSGLIMIMFISYEWYRFSYDDGFSLPAGNINSALFASQEDHVTLFVS